MTDATATGIAVSRAYSDEVVSPLLARRFPGMPFTAGRWGAGSDVLGRDDATSRDHDWGLRLSLLVPSDAVVSVDAALEQSLPAEFRGLPTRFPFTGEAHARHHVEVSTLADFVRSKLGFHPLEGISVLDWLSLSGQAALEVVAGPVFTAHDDELLRVRRALAWYPDDVWRYILASDWARVAQELPLMGRAADVGDELGSRILAARLAHVVMHLSFMLERRWPPYAKWMGSLFLELPGASALRLPLHAAVSGADWHTRERGIADALELLLVQQNARGLTSAPLATVPFWDRPYVHPDPAIVAQLLEPIQDPQLLALQVGLGSAEQRTDNVDILVDPAARRHLVRA
jgi:hypothetical protein